LFKNKCTYKVFIGEQPSQGVGGLLKICKENEIGSLDKEKIKID